jgi:hypothetical protein
MSDAQVFSFKDYSLSTVDLIAPDDIDDDERVSEADERMARYARLGKRRWMSRSACSTWWRTEP